MIARKFLVDYFLYCTKAAKTAANTDRNKKVELCFLRG